MNNNLHVRVARYRAANLIHHCSASNGLSIQLQHLLATRLPRCEAPLRAQWSRNPVSGVMECRWVPTDVSADTQPPLLAKRSHIKTRMLRRDIRAGMRLPSRKAQ